MSAEPSDFLVFLAQPAEDDEDAEMKAWARFMCCPDCKASYPTFYSPTGVLGTFCGSCGWASDEEAALAAAEHGAPKEDM